MKTKKEFSQPENVIQNKPAIYYVVKGRKIMDDNQIGGEFFEATFVDENPIIAREQAFSFYQNYALVLAEHKLLFQKQLPDAMPYFNEDFGGETLQKYSTADVTYPNSYLFDKGIAVFMVVEKPISYMNKIDKKGDRFLIHGIWNFDESDMKNMINGLIREYRYYTKRRNDLKNYLETIDFSDYITKENSQYSIISTPFNWDFNYYLNKCREIQKTKNRLFLYKSRITKGPLEKNAFETRLDNNKFVRIIASFLNTNGGMLFFGINEQRRSSPVFEKVKPAVFKKEMNLLLLHKFDGMPNGISLNFIRVGANVVAVFTVTANYDTPFFLIEN
jgi:hypothetical protein